VLRYDTMKCRPGHEGALIKALLNCLSGYDIWIGHNSERFDWRFIKSRACVLGIELPRRIGLSYDTKDAFGRCGFLTVPNFIGKPTKSLDFVIDFFGFKQRKTKIYPMQHWQEVYGDPKTRREAIDFKVGHCVDDVNMTEKIFTKIWAADPKRAFRQLV
jgi:hypothetical protein